MHEISRKDGLAVDELNRPSYLYIVFSGMNLDTINGISIFKPLLGSIVSIADVEPNTNIIRMPLSNSLSVTT
jgi:hypothetical protein